MYQRLLNTIKSRYFALLEATSNIWMQLGRKFSRYVGMGKSQSHSESLDITQVMKTSKTLMGEILLEKLLPKLMKVVLELTTSTKGFIILKEEENFTIKVIANCHPTTEIRLESLSLDRNNLLPKSVINHVVESQESFVLNSAINEKKIISDPYIKQNQPKSILCVPLFGKFQLIGIIYLENSLLENGFKPNQVKILQLMSPAAGLCIENAQLYQQLGEYSRSLELKVTELAQTNQSLQTEVLERQRAEQVSRGQTAVLTSTLNTLTKEAELDKFLETTLASITKELSASSSAIWLYDSEQDKISNYMCYPKEHNFQEQESSKISLPTQTYILTSEHPFWKMLNSTTDHVYVNLEQEEILPTQWHQSLVEQHVKSLFILPLLINNKLLGLLSIRCIATENFPSELLELAVALAKQASLAMQLTDLANKSRSTAILEERNRLAREIHDTLAQTFTGISLQVGVAQRIVNQEPAEAWSLMGRVGELAREGLTEARRSVWALCPEALEYNNLPEALSRSVEQVTIGTSVQTQVNIQGTPRSLPPETSLNLLRIAQEALTNALKYAQAQFILIELSFTPVSVKLRVKDDGRGFDLQHPTKGGGFGLIGMRQRTKKLGGELHIFSQPGQGTEIAVEIFTLNAGDS